MSQINDKKYHVRSIRKNTFDFQHCVEPIQKLTLAHGIQGIWYHFPANSTHIAALVYYMQYSILAKFHDKHTSYFLLSVSNNSVK